MITITDTAAEQIKKQLIDEPEETGMRITVVGGGCSGFQYELGFSQKRHGDYLIFNNGILILIDEESLKLVDGMILDYKSGLHGAGLVFDNPNASRTCGCGISFSTQ
ncbi:MAG TPA: iron-sulfur cluster assembly accessory protein [Candidatus Paceibacterota bacterium]